MVSGRRLLEILDGYAVQLVTAFFQTRENDSQDAVFETCLGFPGIERSRQRNGSLEGSLCALHAMVMGSTFSSRRIDVLRALEYQLIRTEPELQNRGRDSWYLGPDLDTMVVGKYVEGGAEATILAAGF